MRRTVRRIIRREDGLLVVSGMHDARTEGQVQRLGRVLKSDYVVTYVLDLRGRLFVERWQRSPIPGILGVPVCFLPVEWVGLRVRRTVVSRRSR